MTGHREMLIGEMWRAYAESASMSHVLDALTTGPVFEAMAANAVEGIWPGSGTVFQATGGPGYWDRLIADALRAALGVTATTPTE